MRLTEHEMTSALQGLAKTVLATQRRDIRKGKVDVEAAWDELNRYQRFKLLDALGDQVLPVLVALPDVDVQPGMRPAFTDAQIAQAVEAKLGDSGGRLRRKALVVSRVALVRTALANIPPRSDPHGLAAADLP